MKKNSSVSTRQDTLPEKCISIFRAGWTQEYSLRKAWLYFILWFVLTVGVLFVYVELYYIHQLKYVCESFGGVLHVHGQYFECIVPQKDTKLALNFPDVSSIIKHIYYYAIRRM